MLTCSSCGGLSFLENFIQLFFLKYCIIEIRILHLIVQYLLSKAKQKRNKKRHALNMRHRRNALFIVGAGKLNLRRTENGTADNKRDLRH